MKKIISFVVMGLLSMPFIYAQSEVQIVSDSASEKDTVAVAPVKDTASMEAINLRDSLVPEEALPEVRLISLGVSAGLNMAGYRTNMEGGGMRLGGQIGVNMEFPIGQYLAIQPEMILSLRGGKYDYASLEYGVKEPGESLFYMDIPVNVKFSKRMGKGRPFVSVAPMFSFGIYGSTTYEKVEGDAVSETKVSLFQCDPELEQEDATYSNFDFGFCFKLGYDMDNFWSVAAGYSVGLTEMYNVSAVEKKLIDKYGGEEPSLKNHNIFVTVGYRF